MTTEHLSNKRLNIILPILKRVYYCLDKTFEPSKKGELILRYEWSLKIVSHTHTNVCKIYKYLFWISYMNMEKTYFLEFGLLSFLNFSFWRINITMAFIYTISIYSIIIECRQEIQKSYYKEFQNRHIQKVFLSYSA